MNQEFTLFILKELSKRRDRKDIIRRVCEQGGLHRREAERLIILLAARHRPSITTHQTPWLLFLSVGVLLLGLGLLAVNLQGVLAFFQMDVPDQVMNLRSNSYQLIGSITGLGMIVGGLTGLWKAFEVIFPK